MREVDSMLPDQNPAHESDHFGVGVRPAAKENHARSGSPLESQDARVVEVCGDHDSLLSSSDFEDLGVVALANPISPA
jgi:hypothetical protein